MTCPTKADHRRVTHAYDSELIKFINDGVAAKDGKRITVNGNSRQHPLVTEKTRRSTLEKRAFERIGTIWQIYGSSGGTKLGPRPKFRDYVSS